MQQSHFILNKTVQPTKLSCLLISGDISCHGAKRNLGRVFKSRCVRTRMSLHSTLKSKTIQLKVENLFYFRSNCFSCRTPCFYPTDFFCFKVCLGARCLTGESLEVVWAKFSTLSQPVLFQSKARTQPLPELKNRPRLCRVSRSLSMSLLVQMGERAQTCSDALVTWINWFLFSLCPVLKYKPI